MKRNIKIEVKTKHDTITTNKEFFRITNEK